MFTQFLGLQINIFINYPKLYIYETYFVYTLKKLKNSVTNSILNLYISVTGEKLERRGEEGGGFK